MTLNADAHARIVVFSGPSGSGKNALLAGVLARCDACVRLVTATTRAVRDGEQHGVDYYFLSTEEFLTGIDTGDIPEHWHAADTNRYYGTYVPALKESLAQGNVILGQLQIEGFRYLKKAFGALGVFVVADSHQELERRIRERQPDITNEEMQERLQKADEEVHEHAQEYDYTVVNARGKLDDTIQEVMDILRKEQYL